MGYSVRSALSVGLLGAMLAIGTSAGAVTVTNTPAVAGALALTNGSFETESFFGTSKVLSSGSTAVQGWNVVNGSVKLVDTAWAAQDGHYSLSLNGSAPGMITQSLTGLTAGETYTLNFDMSGDPSGAQGIKTLLAGVGALAQVFSVDTTGTTVAKMNWQSESMTFIAPDTSAQLVFASLTPGSSGPVIDNVSVVAAPIPAAPPAPVPLAPGMPLLGSALGLLAAVRFLGKRR